MSSLYWGDNKHISSKANCESVVRCCPHWPLQSVDKRADLLPTSHNNRAPGKGP